MNNVSSYMDFGLVVTRAPELFNIQREALVILGNTMKGFKIGGTPINNSIKITCKKANRSAWRYI
jgi:hypothetical protein